MPFGHCSLSGRLESFPNTPQISIVNVMFDILGGVVFVYDWTVCGPWRAWKSYFRVSVIMSLQSIVMEDAGKGKARKAILKYVPNNRGIVTSG